MLVTSFRATAPDAIDLSFQFRVHHGPAGARVDAGDGRMRAFYRHTQTGMALRWVLILPAIGLLAIGFAATGWAFSSLTVEVTLARLTWFFGPGLLRKSIEREAIIGVTTVRNPWWYGWGIHLTPRGWLYNVGGLDAVELALSTGSTLRIGSDEAAALAKALM
jgi:hypothetical protein